MIEFTDAETPAGWVNIRDRTLKMGFNMASDARVGSLLKALATSKPGGTFLEMGTGTGLATAWILAGMDAALTLISVDHDRNVQTVAQEFLSSDPRVKFVVQDGATFLRSAQVNSIDFLFADAMSGKYEDRLEALALVRRGGFYIGDDMLPRPSWPEDHQPRVDELLAAFRSAADWSIAAPTWAGGLVIAVRK